MITILCLGISHHTASIECREQLTYTPAALKASLARFGCGHPSRPTGIAEMVILSTCNRLELYACISNNAAQDSSSLFAPLADFLAETRGIEISKFETYFYRYRELEAARHLCQVASGLDSMIVGEPQILGQVAEAFEAAASHGAAGAMLSALFRTAIRAGKRARTETAISRDPASISSVAVKLAENIVGKLTSRHAVIVGAGEMGELAIEALRARGVGRVTVVSRTRQRALELAERWGGQPLSFEQLSQVLHTADIVIASTGAPHTIIDSTMIQEAMLHRAGRPLLLMDIALPRNIDPAVGEVPDVHLFDIDQLHQRLENNLAGRQNEIPNVEAIIEQEVASFASWLRRVDILPVITDLRSKAEEIRRRELKRTLRYLPELDPETLKHIEHLSESLVNKLLHEPTRRLRVEAGNGHATHYTQVTRHLFGLEESSDQLALIEGLEE
jgi:glutamyl-tRNA reductase